MVAILGDHSFENIALLFALYQNKNIIVPITSEIQHEIQEKIKDIAIPQKDIKKAYQKLKRRYKKGKVPSYDEAKESLKMELARDKYMQRLIKQIKVKLK